MDNIISTFQNNTHYCFTFDSTIDLKTIYFEKGPFIRNM